MTTRNYYVRYKTERPYFFYDQSGYYDPTADYNADDFGSQFQNKIMFFIPSNIQCSKSGGSSYNKINNQTRVINIPYGTDEWATSGVGPGVDQLYPPVSDSFTYFEDDSFFPLNFLITRDEEPIGVYNFSIDTGNSSLTIYEYLSPTNYYDPGDGLETLVCSSNLRIWSDFGWGTSLINLRNNCLMWCQNNIHALFPSWLDINLVLFACAPDIGDSILSYHALVYHGNDPYADLTTSLDDLSNTTNYADLDDA